MAAPLPFHSHSDAPTQILPALDAGPFVLCSRPRWDARTNLMETIGKYRIVSELGRGGMGVVYHAHDTVIRRDVAIKVLHEHAISDSAVERFHREARSAGRLSHDNVMTLYDFGESDGRPYLVMELLDGTDLRPLTRNRQIPLRRKLEILIQIASGLDYAHDNRVIHRDIKPGNIQVMESGRVKIVDFGIARVDSEAGTTMTHASLGTPRYMSPEQIRGEGIDRRSDIFSYGALAYELIAERVPFEGENVTTVMYNVIHKEPRPIRLGDPSVDAEIQSIVSGCLAKNMDDRFPDLRGVINRLAALSEDPRVDRIPNLPIDDTTVLPGNKPSPSGGASGPVIHEDTVPSFDRSQVPEFPVRADRDREPDAAPAGAPAGDVERASEQRSALGADGEAARASRAESSPETTSATKRTPSDVSSFPGASLSSPPPRNRSRAKVLWIAGAALVILAAVAIGSQWLGRPSPAVPDGANESQNVDVPGQPKEARIDDAAFRAAQDAMVEARGRMDTNAIFPCATDDYEAAERSRREGEDLETRGDFALASKAFEDAAAQYGRAAEAATRADRIAERLERAGERHSSLGKQISAGWTWSGSGKVTSGQAGDDLASARESMAECRIEQAENLVRSAEERLAEAEATITRPVASSNSPAARPNTAASDPPKRDATRSGTPDPAPSGSGVPGTASAGASGSAPTESPPGAKASIDTDPPQPEPAAALSLSDRVRSQLPGVSSALAEAMKTGRWNQLPPSVRNTYQAFQQALTEDHIIRDAKVRTGSLRESGGIVEQQVTLEVVQQQKGRDDLMDPVTIPMIWTWNLDGDDAIVSQVRP